MEICHMEYREINGHADENMRAIGDGTVQSYIEMI